MNYLPPTRDNHVEVTLPYVSQEEQSNFRFRVLLSPWLSKSKQSYQLGEMGSNEDPIILKALI